MMRLLLVLGLGCAQGVHLDVGPRNCNVPFQKLLQSPTLWRRRNAAFYSVLLFAGQGLAASAVEKKPSANIVVAELEQTITERNMKGDPVEHVPRISFESGKVVRLRPNKTQYLPHF